MDTELYMGPETWEMAEAASVMLDGSLATAERTHELASREMAAALTLCTPAEARAALLGLHGGGMASEDATQGDSSASRGSAEAGERPAMHAEDDAA